MLLYKYFPPERSSLLRELLLRFTPPDLFNDPFDSLPSIGGFDTTFIRETVEKSGWDLAVQCALEEVSETERQRKLATIPQANEILFKAYSSDPTVLEEYFLSSHRKRVSRDIGILCLSENQKSILMWSHYADKHNGFVVGFDTENAFFRHQPREPEDIGRLFRVNYKTVRTFIDVKTIKTMKSFPDIFFTKNREWFYEREWRIIRFLKDANETRSENIHLFKVPPTAIQEVIFGCRAKSQTVGDLVDSIKSNSDLNHVVLCKAALSRTRFEMDIIPYLAR